VTWNNEPSASGDPVLKMDFQVNYYMKKVIACDSTDGPNCTDLYGTPDIDMNGVSTGDFSSTNSETDFLVYIAWATPESASTTNDIDYDSVDAHIRIDVEAGPSSLSTEWFDWNAYWAPRYSAETVAANNKTGCC
jgi:hypothetical protein